MRHTRRRTRLAAVAWLVILLASAGCGVLSGQTSAESTREKYRHGARDPLSDAGNRN